MSTRFNLSRLKLSKWQSISNPVRPRHIILGPFHLLRMKIGRIALLVQISNKFQHLVTKWAPSKMLWNRIILPNKISLIRKAALIVLVRILWARILKKTMMTSIKYYKTLIKVLIVQWNQLKRVSKKKNLRKAIKKFNYKPKRWSIWISARSLRSNTACHQPIC